jgi:heme iron utilization protein
MANTMMLSTHKKRKIQKLIDTQNLAVLATFSGVQPYTNLIAFTICTDYKELVFATLRNTTKYKNLQQNKNVSILFDNRDKKPIDFMKFITITAMGSVEEVKKNDYKEILIRKHPYLNDFLNNDDCVILKVNIKQYILVEKFEDITIFTPY